MSGHSEALMQLMAQTQGVTTLFLENVVREVDIGVHDHELGAPQRLQFDIYVMLSGVSEPSADEIGEVLNYEYLISALDETLQMNRAALLETLANRLLDRVLEPNSAEGASVILTKLDVLEGDGQLGCSMTRLK
ncbi:MAG: dihydroneopterin aldolase [Candidatus Thalassarchaeaceae archaeon]|jgi:dihydroneopterin aldolase|nr:dihydroneopterin aldolase [Candidatus Thalassarchaeaceae archaeon]